MSKRSTSAAYQVVQIFLLLCALIYIGCLAFGNSGRPVFRSSATEDVSPSENSIIEGRELVTVFPGWEFAIGRRVNFKRNLPYAGADVTSASYQVDDFDQ